MIMSILLYQEVLSMLKYLPAYSILRCGSVITVNIIRESEKRNGSKFNKREFELIIRIVDRQTGL